MTGGIFAILDDIAILADDVAVMSKVAAKKTAGILGDDLAVNAEKATGFSPSRELPVLWAITKGSFINKVIILPLAFLMSAYVPWLIVPVLLLGGAYLCYEGMEKVVHTLAHSAAQQPTGKENHGKDGSVGMEKAKITSAVRTDFILSIEIVVIALGTVMHKPLPVQFAVVGLIALLATVGVYGVVALLVRMDDMGFYLIARMQGKDHLPASWTRSLGSLLVAGLPYIIRALGVVGTLAMLLVGGGIYLHNVALLHHLADYLPSLLANLILGMAVGGLLVVCVGGLRRLLPLKG